MSCKKILFLKANSWIINEFDPQNRVFEGIFKHYFKHFQACNSGTEIYESMRFSPKLAQYQSLTPHKTWKKTLGSFLRNIQKTPFLTHFGPFMPQISIMETFFKNPALLLFLTSCLITSCKKSQKSVQWLSRSFDHGLSTNILRVATRL